MGCGAKDGATGGATPEDAPYFIQNRASLYSAACPDVARNVFNDASLPSFPYADCKTAIKAFDSDSERSNLLQLQVGANQATLTGNANDNVAVRRWWAG